MTTAVLSGLLKGFQEFLLAPSGLWWMHQQILTTPMRSHLDASSSATGQRVNEQAVRRQRLLEATGDGGVQGRRNNAPSSSLSPHSLKVLNENEVARRSTSSSRKSAEGILKLLGHIWLFNFLLVFVMWLVFQLLALMSYGSFGFWFSSIRMIFNLVILVLQTCIFLVMELVNVIYLKKICEKIYMLQQKKKCLRDSLLSDWPVASPSTPSYGIGKSLMDRVYSIIFFVVYRLQWKLITTFIPNFWINLVINSISEAFMYACYAFEYHARQTSDVTFHVMLLQIMSHWSFFVGYGLPLGLSIACLPGWDDLLIAFTYPVLVVGAFQVPWSRSLTPNYRVPSWTCSLLFLSMRPALITTDALFSLFVSVGCWLCSASVNVVTSSSSLSRRQPVHR